MSFGQATTPRFADLGPATEYVADTGPLLCLGASKYLRSVFRGRCHGKTHWVAAVRAELLNQARGTDARARAARAYTGLGASWLTAVVTFSTADGSELSAIKSRLEQLAKDKERHSGRRALTHPLAHLGETQSILHARRNTYTLLAHDNDARRVAREHGVPAATLIAFAQRLVSEGEPVKRLADEFQTLRADGINLGGPFTGPLDLMPRPNPPTPKQRPVSSPPPY